VRLRAIRMVAGLDDLPDLFRVSWHINEQQYEQQ